MTFQELNERVIKKRVVRDNKRVKIKTSDKEGYKIVDGKEVRISAKERLNRAKGSKKAIIKRKSKQGQANRKRKLSMNKV